MNDQPVIFVNVFDVEPDRQQELIDVLACGARDVIRHRPGFLSLTLLASHDGRHVVNLARWTDAGDARNTQADPQAADHAARATAIATSTPGLYRVAAEIA